MQVAAGGGRGTGQLAPDSAQVATTSRTSLLLTESQQSIGGPPSLMEKLTPRERETVLKQGRRKVLNRGQTLFNQGAKHDGIFLIESGRIRVFYIVAARARDYAGLLACRQFRRRTGSVRRRHASMVGRCDQQLQRGAASRQGVARAGRGDAESRDRPDRGPDFQGQMLLGAGADAGHPLDHRSGWRICSCIWSELYGVEDPDGVADRRGLHPCRPRAHGRRHPAMGHDQPEAHAGEADRASRSKSQIVVLPARPARGDARPGVGLNACRKLRHAELSLHEIAQRLEQPAFPGN